MRRPAYRRWARKCRRYADGLTASPLFVRPVALAPRRKERTCGSGWLVGLILGAICGLWMLPPVRYTLGSQLRFGLAQDSLPWLRTFESQRNLSETARLDAAAALLPDDYLLQVGRATALVAPTPSQDLASHDEDTSDPSDNGVPDHTLIRLTTVARDFPLAPGAQAHLARSMMADRIRIQRPEVAPTSPRLIPPRYTDVKLMTWALRNGERADPDNAFWPAMLAVTYFAAGRDQQGVDALALCALKSRWDSYLYEEVLGQWRLYSLAYGDHGAAQKIGPLTLLAFPHLRELRRMAETARGQADRAAERGEVARAIQIRRSIRLLGHVLRDNATWAYEALYGTDLLLIAACDSDAGLQQSGIRTVQDWEQQAQGYLTFLRKNGRRAEITVLYAEVEESCRLRAQVDVARADASYPGIPPGIPLIALFSDWMAGVSLLQQAVLLSLCALAARFWPRRRTHAGRGLRLLAWSLGSVFIVGIATLLGTALPSSRLAVLLYASMCALFVFACGRIQASGWSKQTRRTAMPTPKVYDNEAGNDETGGDEADSNEISSDRVGDNQVGDNQVGDDDAFDKKAFDNAVLAVVTTGESIKPALHDMSAGPAPHEVYSCIACMPDDRVSPADKISFAETRLAAHWRRGTTLRFTLVLAVGTGLLLYSLRGLFSGLHPVALLLSSMMGIAPPATAIHALQVGLLACALPLLLILLLCVWALRRGFPVVSAIVYGLRRMFLPALAGLALAYLLLLNQTLRLDAEATHAINEAARDDLHWVLTHSEDAE